MASRTITLYLHPTTAARLIRGKLSGRSAAEEVRLLADIVDQLELAIPELLRPQWLALFEALSHHKIEQVRDIKHLPYIVEERLRGSDIAKRHLIDRDGLIHRVRQFKFYELVALAAEIERSARGEIHPES